MPREYSKEFEMWFRNARLDYGLVAYWQEPRIKDLAFRAFVAGKRRGKTNPTRQRPLR